MAESGGDGENKGERIARFSIPNDDNDGDDVTRRHQQEVTLATLNEVFSRDLQIFHQVDEHINEVWAQKPPKVVCNYIFGREIGHGSYGKVKEVMNRGNGVVYACKIMKDKQICKIANGMNNVEKEYHILEKLNHQNVVKLIESFRIEAKSKVYYIFEYCVTSIDGLLNDATPSLMNEYQAHYYFKQLIDGLDYLHRIGIIHKDIKPHNLLISEEGVLKIADFGVAEQLKNPDDDWCSLSQGTPALQAPEVIGTEQKDFRGKMVDIWASGVTLFRIVTGKYPFDGDVLMLLFDNILKEPFKVPEGVKLSDSLLELISGMLVKNPESRWTIDEIKRSRWLTSFHNIDEHNLIELPVIDHTYFDDLIEEIEDNPDDVIFVSDATPFNGVYPPHVQDRTLQTPATSKNFNYDREVNTIDPELRVTLNPADGVLPPPNTPLVKTNSHPGISGMGHHDVPQQQQLQPRQRRHHRSLFACFKSKTESP